MLRQTIGQISKYYNFANNNMGRLIWCKKNKAIAQHYRNKVSGKKVVFNKRIQILIKP